MRIEKMKDLKEKYNIEKKVIDYLDNEHKNQGAQEGFLTELQKDVFSNPSFWDDSQNVIVQGRTSSGKTLLAQIATLYFGGKETDGPGSARKKVIYLVPLRAMVNEKRDDFKKIFFDTLGWRVYASSSDYQDHDEDITASEFEVAIIVYEKFFALLAQDNQFIRNCGLIVIDELQMMNDGSRGPKLEIALTKVLDINYACKILGLTTIQCEVSQIGIWLNAEIIKNCSRPKALEEYVVWPAESGEYFHYYMKEETEDGRSNDSNKDGLDDGNKIDLDGHYMEIHEKDKHVEEKMIPELIRYLRKGKENNPPKIIVFINNKKYTNSIAIDICNHLDKKTDFRLDTENERIQSFLFSEDEYAGEILNKTLPYGVAFHHGGFSWALREFVEEEFRKEKGMIDIVVATETLAIGVNMPADIVILAGITLPRANHFKAEMRSHEYKNYVGRAGRLGKSSEKKGRSYLLAPTQAKAYDYWNRYVNAREVKISSALRMLPQEEQVPFFFNLIGSNAGANNNFDAQKFNVQIKKSLAYCDETNPTFFPGQIFIDYLKEYGLIEENFGGGYSRSRIGNELASYALDLNSVNIIMSICQILARTAEREFGSDSDFRRKDILRFMERHYLDILFCLSRAPELANIFIYNFDEMAYTKDVMNFVREKKEQLLKEFPLYKILHDTFDEGKPMPSLSNSFALKRAVCMIEWVEEKSLTGIRKETGLSYVALGDLDRLGDVFAYMWEAMARVLPAYCGKFAPYRIMLMRLSGRLKYGVGYNLIVLASRHVQYVTRSQLIELKKEAEAEGLSPEQYVRDMRYINTQKALRRKQFLDLGNEMNEHYSSSYLKSNIELEANKLKQEDVIDDDICTTIKSIYWKKESHYSDIKSLFQLPYCNIKIKEEANYIQIGCNSRIIRLIILDSDNGISRDAFRTSLKLIRGEDPDKKITYIFLLKEMVEKDKYEQEEELKCVFVSTQAFIKLYLLSLKKSSSLSLFFESLYCGYFFVPEKDSELTAYVENFIPEENVMISNDGGEENIYENPFVLYVVQDKVKCNVNRNISAFLNNLKEMFRGKRLETNYVTWSSTISGFTNEILCDNNSGILVFIDSDLKNEQFISIIIDLLIPFLGKKKILLSYLDNNAKEVFLKEHAAFTNINDICLDSVDSIHAAQMAFDVFNN